MNFEKKALKYLNPKDELSAISKSRRLRLKAEHGRKGLYFRLHIKPKLIRVLRHLDFIERLPMSLIVFMLIAFTFGVLIVNQHVMKEYWKNTVVEAFPDITYPKTVDAKGNIHLNPIDSIFTEMVARTQAYMWLFFWVMLSIVLGKLMRGVVPPKPQTIPKVRKVKR